MYGTSVDKPSSGPSARRNVLAWAYISTLSKKELRGSLIEINEVMGDRVGDRTKIQASGKSLETPPPPCTWMALSTIVHAIRGATTCN